MFEGNQGGPENWGEVKKLTATVPQTLGGFGFGVAISGDTAIGGAIGETNAGGSQAGAAYVFKRDQGGPDTWGEVTKLTASDAEAGDGFGGSLKAGRGVALSGDTAVVGARGEDTGGADAGAAYVFDRLLPKPTPTTTPTPDPSVGGIAELPEVAGAPLETGGSSGGNAGVLAGVAGAVAAGAVAMGGAAWYARRRRS